MRNICKPLYGDTFYNKVSKRQVKIVCVFKILNIWVVNYTKDGKIIPELTISLKKFLNSFEKKY